MSCPPFPRGLSWRSIKTLQTLRDPKHPFIVDPRPLDDLVDELIHGDHQPMMKWVLEHEITQKTKVKGHHRIPTHRFTDPERMTMVRFLANACDQQAEECFASLLRDFQVSPMILDLASEDHLAIELGDKDPSPGSFSMLGHLVNSDKFDCNYRYLEDDDTHITWIWDMVSENNLERALFALFASPEPFDLTEFRRETECGPDDEPKTASVNVLELYDLMSGDCLEGAKQRSSASGCGPGSMSRIAMPSPRPSRTRHPGKKQIFEKFWVEFLLDQKDEAILDDEAKEDLPLTLKNLSLEDPSSSPSQPSSSIFPSLPTPPITPLPEFVNAFTPCTTTLRAATWNA